MKRRKIKYATWQEASIAAVSLGFTTRAEYSKAYSSDPMLYAEPSISYEDFPGWVIFLQNENVHKGGRAGNFYKNWKQAVRSMVRLHIRTYAEYVRRYHRDIRLPSAIYIKYPDFPGFPVSKELLIPKTKPLFVPEAA